MRQSFNHFAVRYLTAVLLGLLLLLLHGPVQGGVFAPLVPQSPSGWELSKLAFWPMLAACLAAEGVRGLPAAVLTPPVTALVCWAVQAAEGGGRLCLTFWVALAAAGTAFGPDGGKRRRLWAALAVLLAACYVLLTYLPPAWGPFLAPTAAFPD